MSNDFSGPFHVPRSHGIPGWRVFPGQLRTVLEKARHLCRQVERAPDCEASIDQCLWSDECPDSRQGISWNAKCGSSARRMRPFDAALSICSTISERPAIWS